MIITGVLVPTTDGTRVQWMMKVGGTLPRWLLRPLTPFIARWVQTNMEKGWLTLERLMTDVEKVGLPS
jgi:hypothetical protein